ncbi:MAG: hypothetical protein MZV49_00225 [Rhodopseudomonas palustris]|nr:hypothetical protein [Rhodopseudomonas palustris]
MIENKPQADCCNPAARRSARWSATPARPRSRERWPWQASTYFILDTEHGSYSLETVSDMMQMARLSRDHPARSACRISTYPFIARTLDAGAHGRDGTARQDARPGGADRGGREVSTHG